MTDITPILPAGGPGGIDPTGDKKTHRNPAAGGPSFADVLAGAANPAAGLSGPTGASGPHALPPAYIGPVGEAPSAQQSVLQSGERMLNLIDSYRDMLGDGRSTLKDIDPVVQQLETERDRILEQIGSLKQGDPGRNLLQEMAVLASSEVSKFRRGDYI